jgi:hypothetical protein
MGPPDATGSGKTFITGAGGQEREEEQGHRLQWLIFWSSVSRGQEIETRKQAGDVKW